MTPNDSGEREVMQICGLCHLVLPVPSEHICPNGNARIPVGTVVLSQPLAQRILALIEDVGDMALAAELRAIVERKT